MRSYDAWKTSAPSPAPEYEGEASYYCPADNCVRDGSWEVRVEVFGRDCDPAFEPYDARDTLCSECGAQGELDEEPSFREDREPDPDRQRDELMDR